MLSPTVLSTVLQTGLRVATHSWEYGTASLALLEWQNSSLSIWNQPFPSAQLPSLDPGDVPALSYIEPKISTTGSTLIEASGAAGDPASLGIPALLLGVHDQAYRDAAWRQMEHLMNDVPRWDNGAISHREAYAELWADFVHMVPPFLAYYGVAGNNVWFVKEAARQCGLYAEVLGNGGGAWKHIIGPENADEGRWSTGNAWAAMGMARVLATMRKGPFDADTRAEQGQLSGLIKSILDASIAFDVDSSGLLRNYLDDGSWWGEVSGTSLLAATAFRMSILEPGTFGAQYTDWATRKMKVVDGLVDEATGIVAPAVNPLGWKKREPYMDGSPEGQAFVVMMHAAERDWRGKSSR